MASGSFLDRLRADDRAAIESAASRRTYRKGSLVFLDGDTVGDVLLITSGQIKITVASHDGREVLIDIRGEGEVIGEMSLIDNSPRSASAFALTSPTEALVIPVRAFREFVDNEFSFTRVLLDEMVSKLRDTTRHQLEFGLDDVGGRVNRRIAELSRRFGRVRGDGTVEIRSPITQQELADWAGVSRQAVVKELTRLRDLDWIETKGSRIILRNPDAIYERAARFHGLDPS
ncbi:MAG: Crp/Fnr family transcriptional regulator [Acidimicrobiales bacterium]